MKETTKAIIILTALIIEIVAKLLLAALILKALWYLAFEALRDQGKRCTNYKQTTCDSTTIK